jgi:hypothetical protein
VNVCPKKQLNLIYSLIYVGTSNKMKAAKLRN